MKKSLGALSALILFAIAGATPALADQNPLSPSQRLQTKSDSWDPATNGTWDGETWLFGASFMAGQMPGAPAPMIQDVGNASFCDDLNEGCNPAADLVMRGYAQMCSGVELVSSCIRGVEFRKAGGDWIEASLVDTWSVSPSPRSLTWLNQHLASTNHGLGELIDLSTTSGWSERPEWNAPNSGPGPLVFSAPDFLNSGGSSNYLVNLQYFAAVDPKQKATKYQDFELAISPILIEEYAPAHVGVEIVTKAPGREPAFGGTGPGFRSADFATEGRVAYAARFAEGVEARVTLEVPELIGGWFHSRLSEPDFELTSIGKRRNLLQISGSHAEIPITNTFVPGLDPKYKSIVEKYESPYWLERRRSGQSSGGISGTVWGTNSGVGIFRDWQPYLSETAKGSAQAWIVSRLPQQRLGNNKCLNDSSRIQGLINTNAMVYQAEIPVYSNGFLTYQVAGVHRSMDGSLNIGEYDLQIRSETARCIYGFSKAPVSAVVSVLNESGKEVVATTVVSEKDGWLKLAAYGFTFSEKEIQVKITQPQTRTLTAYSRTATALTSKQKAEIRATVTRGGANSKFICTGIRLEGQSQAMNNLVRQRAKLACDYAKSLNPKLSTFFQTKTTKSRSFNGKVMVVSR